MYSFDFHMNKLASNRGNNSHRYKLTSEIAIHIIFNSNYQKNSNSAYIFVLWDKGI